MLSMLTSTRKQEVAFNLLVTNLDLLISLVPVPCATWHQVNSVALEDARATAGERRCLSEEGADERDLLVCILELGTQLCGYFDSDDASPGHNNVFRCFGLRKDRKQLFRELWFSLSEAAYSNSKPSHEAKAQCVCTT